MTTLAQIKRSVQAGQVYDVTNHYITRPDHPCYGTQRRTVLHVNGSAFVLSQNGKPGASRVAWPKAAQVQQDADGTLRLYGGGTGQTPGDLFLTMTPVTAEPDSCCSHGPAAVHDGVCQCGAQVRPVPDHRLADDGEAETAPCVMCGDPAAPAGPGDVLCSACGDQQELKQSRDVLDWIAGLLRQPYSGTLNAIAGAVKGTGRDVAAPETVNGHGTRQVSGAARFMLDDERAAAWLERATRPGGGGAALNGQDHDVSLPDISAGWRPGHDGHNGTVSELLDTAQAAGIITCPAGWRVACEYARDVDGAGYRWLLISGDERRPIILADAFNDAFPDSTGAKAALDLLREAAAAGTELLGDLARCAATTRTMAPVPPPEVWVLEYEHKHGTDFTAHTTEDAARLAIAQIARDFWGDVASWHPEMPATPDGLSDEDATRIYFDNFDAEDYHIHGLDVTGAPVAPLQARAPEIAEFAALLPRGGWGADELIALANWLTSHGYDVGDLSEIFNEDFKDNEEPGGYEGFVRRADSSVISVQCSEGRCRQCPDDTGTAEGTSGGGPLEGYYCEHGCRLCGTGGA